MIRKTLYRLLRRRLEDGGERVEIHYAPEGVAYDRLNVYEKNHYRRYEFACSMISPGAVVADWACGTGYGSVMLAQNASSVLGVDISDKVVRTIRRRYAGIKNLRFECSDLLALTCRDELDVIVSFETIEHLPPEDIPKLFDVFNTALKPGGLLVFSTPFKQPASDAALRLGFHRTFGIDEHTIAGWLARTDMRLVQLKYQNYATHDVNEQSSPREMVVGVARKAK